MKNNKKLLHVIEKSYIKCSLSVKSIYSSNDITDENISTYLPDVTCPKLNDKEKEFCDSLLTIDE